MMIIVAAHKPYWMPEDPAYQPIQVGAEGKASISPEWLRDDQGENISAKNRSFCELTGLYWAWRNSPAPVLGMAHYRRYLAEPGLLMRRKLRKKEPRALSKEKLDRQREKEPGELSTERMKRRGKKERGEQPWKKIQFSDAKKRRILSGEQAEALLQKYDVIVPKKRHYFIETRGAQYAHAHHQEDLDVTESVLQEEHPEYLEAWRRMLASRSGHICNMFVMKRPELDAYCEWLFDILFEVERRLDISQYSEHDSRVFGFLGERLLDVYIEMKGLRVAEVPMINLESQHWGKKIRNFLRRKYGKKDI